MGGEAPEAPRGHPLATVNWTLHAKGKIRCQKYSEKLWRRTFSLACSELGGSHRSS